MLPKDIEKQKDYRLKLSLKAKKRVGVLNSNYKDNRTNKDFYCVCGKKLCSFQAKKCRECADKEHSRRMSGKNHPNYRGSGDFTKLVRNCNSYSVWRKEIFKRDNYTCVLCNKVSSGDIEADHIKKFSIILRDFLAKYNMFSSIEDKETLLRLAITYEPFWDLSNGRTLCFECHKKTPTFGNRKHA